MLRFIAKRFIWMVPSLFAASFLAFVLIQLPPGDYATNYIATLAASNEMVDQNTAKDLRERVSPSPAQYEAWIAWMRRRTPQARVPDFDAFKAIAYRHLAVGA